MFVISCFHRNLELTCIVWTQKREVRFDTGILEISYVDFSQHCIIIQPQLLVFVLTLLTLYQPHDETLPLISCHSRQGFYTATAPGSKLSPVILYFLKCSCSGLPNVNASVLLYCKVVQVSLLGPLGLEYSACCIDVHWKLPDLPLNGWLLYSP